MQGEGWGGTFPSPYSLVLVLTEARGNGVDLGQQTQLKTMLGCPLKPGLMALGQRRILSLHPTCHAPQLTCCLTPKAAGRRQWALRVCCKPQSSNCLLVM